MRNQIGYDVVLNGESIMLQSVAICYQPANMLGCKSLHQLK